MLVAVQGFGPISQLLLVVASLLVLADRLAGGFKRNRSIWFFGLAVLGGLGVVANLVEMISLLTRSGLPPVGVGSTAEAYSYIVLVSLVPAILALVPLYVGLAGPTVVRAASSVIHAR